MSVHFLMRLPHHADAVVIGEGEPVWPHSSPTFSLPAARLKPIYDARGFNYSFAHSPMPRFDLLDIDRYNRLTVQTHRGCPFRCEFCAASIRISPTYKIKPVDRVLAEIHAIKALWKRPFIEFADDNTFVNKAHSKQLLRALSGEHVHWFTETDLSVADDHELFDMIRDAGCAEILIGFESTTFSALNGLEQRSNWKAKRLDTDLDAIRNFKTAAFASTAASFSGSTVQDRILRSDLGVCAPERTLRCADHRPDCISRNAPL